MAGRRDKLNSQIKQRARVHVTRRVPPRAESERIHECARKWRVFGTFLGQKKKRGRWTSEVAIVCLTTDEKRPVRQIDKRRRIPKSVSWTERRRRFKIRTDVIRAVPEMVLQLGTVLGPGDGVRFGTSTATVGAAVDHPHFGRCLTTAGHLFSGPSDEGATAIAVSNGASISTRVMRCVRAFGIDYALLRAAAQADCDNLFQDLIRVGPLHVPGVADFGKQLFVLDNERDSVETRCRGIHARLEIGNDVYEDVILCDRVTAGGQSGAALIDADNRIWGFLIGALNGFSVFMPAETLLRIEQSQLA